MAPIKASKPKLKLKSIGLGCSPSCPHQQPRAINAGIWVELPIAKESNKIPKQKPENKPNNCPLCNDQGNNHKTGQHGPTPEMVIHLGERRDKKGRHIPENKKKNRKFLFFIDF